MNKTVAFVLFLTVCLFSHNRAVADGKVIRMRDYKGSLEEQAQEAIILFSRGDDENEAVEDLILKIRVEGDTKQFAWVIPFPNAPETFKEDPKLFKELFQYVQRRTAGRQKMSGKKLDAKAPESGAANDAIQVISHKVVGDFDITVVKENEAGALNPWLNENGYEELEDQDGVLEFYRKRKYVYACVKVTSEALVSEKSIESHPLRFRFKTGGRDGIYFPMKLTGLQTEPFDINLYIFDSAWINDKLNEFGYVHRGFDLVFRDFDSNDCEANAGKSYSAPESDVYLKSFAGRLETVTELCQRLHPGQRYYLTNIQANQLKPENVRTWADDLWVFPYYTDRKFVPLDVREGGPAGTAWPNAERQDDAQSVEYRQSEGSDSS